MHMHMRMFCHDLVLTYEPKHWCFHFHIMRVNTVVGATRGRESSEPEAYMPRNRALVDLLLHRQQDIYCLQVHRTALPALIAGKAGRASLTGSRALQSVCLLTQRP